MIEAGAALAAALEGIRLAVQFNPLVAIVTAAVASAVSGYPRAPRERRHRTELIVAVGWLLGDGLRVLGRARDVYDGVGAPDWSAWTVLALWALGSLFLGYVLPVLAGTAVGRRVTHGTGWLAAAAVAAGLSAAISAAVGALS
ncbi:MAG: hypothetical protein U1E08_05790 [Coriobacteriia bacterium]|nr:hypothetical protein [Coriobacteriia bacterium]